MHARYVIGGYLGYGLLLDWLSALLSGVGEGPVFGWAAAAGAPLSAIHLPAWPLWLFVGWLLATRRIGAAACCLAVHYVTIPWSIRENLRFSWDTEWERAVEMFESAPAAYAFLIAPYPLGQIGTWILVMRAARRPVANDGQRGRTVTRL